MLAMVMGAALFAVEACSDGDDRPPALTNPGQANPPSAAVGSGGAAGGEETGGGGGSTGEGAGGGGGSNDGAGTAGETSEVNPGNGLLPNPTDAIGAAIDGG